MDNPNDILEGTTPQSPDPSILSIQAVRLAKRNQHKETMVQSRPDDASPAPASTATATATATAPASAPPSPPRSPSPTLVGSKTNDEGIQERYEKAVEKGNVIVLDGSPTTDATPVDATAAITATAPASAPPPSPPLVIQERYEKAVEKGDAIVSDGSPTTVATPVDTTAARAQRSAYFDPESNKEVYEWNGVWYFGGDWDGPVGKRWSREGRSCDWRPTVAEEEEYNAWYYAYFKNVVVRRVLKD